MELEVENVQRYIITKKMHSNWIIIQLQYFNINLIANLIACQKVLSGIKISIFLNVFTKMY